MLNLFTRKLKILFQVPELCFLMIKKRKEQCIEFHLFLQFPSDHPYGLTSLGSPICMFHICKVLKRPKLAKT